MEIGYTWNSQRGVRIISGSGSHPSTGNPIYYVQYKEDFDKGSKLAEIYSPDQLAREISINESGYAKMIAADAAKRESDRIQKQHDSWFGFIDTLSTPAARARAIKTLNTACSFAGVYAQRGKNIVRLMEEGAKVEKKSFGRILSLPDGSYLDEKDTTKTALDFADYLINRVLR